MTPIFFKTSADFRRWLLANHDRATELQVGIYKKNSGKGGLTYAEAVDEALCFGWIDGVAHSIDANSYTQRFTPRRPGSNWSLINVGHIARLKKEGRLHPAGLKAFAARDEKKTGIYSFEQPAKSLPAVYEKKFRANKPAWAFFQSQPPGYKRLAIHKIVSPKQEATRERWLACIIAVSADGKRFE